MIEGLFTTVTNVSFNTETSGAVTKGSKPQSLPLTRMSPWISATGRAAEARSAERISAPLKL